MVNGGIGSMTSSPKPTSHAPNLLHTEELRNLVAAAEGGDPESLSKLRELLDSHPEIWQACGDLGGIVEQTLMDLVSGSNLVLKESLARKLTEMKVELSGPAPTPLEKLLVERITACWLQV